MNTVTVSGALALAMLLGACSQPPGEATAERAKLAGSETPAGRVMPTMEAPPQILDAEGNELDPEAAEAVRAELDRQQMQRDEVGDTTDGGYGAPMDSAQGSNGD